MGCRRVRIKSANDLKGFPGRTGFSFRSRLEQRSQKNPPPFPEQDGTKSKLLNDENRPTGRKERLCNHYTRRMFFADKLPAMNGECFNGVAVEPTGWLVRAGVGKMAGQILGFTIPRCSPSSVRRASMNASAHGGGKGPGRRRIRPAGGKRSCAIIAQDRPFFPANCQREMGKADCARPVASKAWAKIMSVGHNAVPPN